MGAGSVRPATRARASDGAPSDRGVPSAGRLSDAADTAFSVAPVSAWRSAVRDDVAAALEEFVTGRCATELVGTGVDVAADVLLQLVRGGKYLRSSFFSLGWLCAPGSAADTSSGATVRAAASFELLQCFALLQDDVMDNATLRRGRPAAHVRFADWHRDRALSGSAGHFGASAAVLLGDLCLVWAEQMLRESGLGADALARAWPRYDTMRTELAVGQFADLVNDARGLPTLEAVLDVARRKSGNYTVRRPLEIGAAAAGCDDATLARLGWYGSAIGEAFQLRDDLLGIFGSPEVTGKPIGSDLAERKATSVVVAAHTMADAPTRRRLTEFMSGEHLDEADLLHWRALIDATGAAGHIEEVIATRCAEAAAALDDLALEPTVRATLDDMAAACTARTA